MLYIKNNRIYTASFSFALPEDLILVTDPCDIKVDTLTLETLDGRYMVEVGAKDCFASAAERIERLQTNPEIIILSDIVPLERGGMKGYGLYYTGAEWRYEYYEEFLEHPMNEEGQSIFNFCIQREIEGEEQRNKVREFFERGNIQSFLSSVRFEPDVCSKVMNSN